MLNTIPALIAEGRRRIEAPAGGRLKRIEHVDQSVQLGLRTLERDLGVLRVLLNGGAPLGTSERSPHSLDDDTLHDGRADRHPLRAAVADMPAATVDRAGAVLRGRRRHAPVAGAAAQHAEPGEQPLALGLPTRQGLRALRVLPGLDIHDGGVRGRVSEVAEVDLAEIGARLQHPTDRCVGQAEAEREDLSDRCTRCSSTERFGDQSGLSVGSEPAVPAAVIAGGEIGAHPYPALHGTDLSLARALGGATPLVLGDEPKEAGAQPLSGAAAGDLPDIERQDLAARTLDTLHDLELHLDRPEQPIEVCGDDDLRIASLDSLNSTTHAVALVEWSAAGHVELVDDLQQVESVAFASGADTVALLAGGSERRAFAASDLADAHDSNGSTGVHGLRILTLMDTGGWNGSMHPRLLRAAWRGLHGPATTLLYAIQADEDGPIKIGATDDPRQRLSTLQTGNPHRLRGIAIWPGSLSEERAIHRLFAADRLQGEWFHPSEDLVALVEWLGGGHACEWYRADACLNGLPGTCAACGIELFA